MSEEKYHRENLRAELIEAGIKIMNEQGYDNLSLRKIALACGVSHAAPYRHFADKDDLLRAMQKYVEVRFSEILEQAIIVGQGAQHPMLGFGKAYVRFFSENPQYYMFFIAHSDSSIHISSKTGQVISDYCPFVIFQTEATKQFQKIGLPKHQYQTGLISMWSKVHGLAAMAVMKSVTYDDNWDHLTEHVLLGVTGNLGKSDM